MQCSEGVKLSDKTFPGIRDIAHWYLTKFQHGSRGFHGDRVLKAFVKNLVRRHGVSAFVETGTFRGETTAFVAQLSPSLPVFTCEVNLETFEPTSVRLARFPNIVMHHSSSPEFLGVLVSQIPLGELPLFWLDAHWYEFWPLRDELSIITSQLERAIILIDDFEIPGRPQFGFDMASSYRGGTAAMEPIKCNLDYIRSALDPRHRYDVIFPKYSRSSAFPFWDDGAMRGYPVVMMDVPSVAESLRKDRLVNEGYEHRCEFHLGMIS